MHSEGRHREKEALKNANPNCKHSGKSEPFTSKHLKLMLNGSFRKVSILSPVVDNLCLTQIPSQTQFFISRLSSTADSGGKRVLSVNR